MMQRRKFITLFGGVAAWPLAARAQQAAMPVIGMLQVGTPSGYDLSGFRQGLKDASYIEGQNLAIEYRFANDDSARLPELAADLVRRQVRVIATIASALAARAAKDATDTIPIVFGHGVDPVKLGLVASLNRPGGNATGIISLANELYGKQLGILHELLPQAVHFAVLANPKGLLHQAIVNDTQAAAAAIGQTVEILDAGTSGEIDAVFARLGDEKRAHLYVGRILKGENPAELPVQQMSKFELVINLKTAKALGLGVPNSMQLLADDVIE
jgi:putative ABC transport system substrate-binding protein